MKRIGLVFFLLCLTPTSKVNLPSEDVKLAGKLMHLAHLKGERPKYRSVLKIARAAIKLGATCIPGIIDKRDFVAIAWTESRFNPDTVGKAGEKGAWQILEYKALGKKLGVRDPYKVESNAEMACEVLREKYKEYHSYKKTIQAFNGLSPKTREYKYYRLIQRFKSKV